MGLLNESIEYSEMSVGTHEKISEFSPLKDMVYLTPTIGFLHSKSKPGFLNKCESYCPMLENGKIVNKTISGRMIHHGNNIIILKFIKYKKLRT